MSEIADRWANFCFLVNGADRTTSSFQVWCRSVNEHAFEKSVGHVYMTEASDLIDYGKVETAATLEHVWAHNVGVQLAENAKKRGQRRRGR